MTEFTGSPEELKNLELLISRQGEHNFGGITDPVEARNLQLLMGPAPEPVDDSGMFMKSIKRGIRHQQANFSAFGATLAKTFSHADGDSMDFLSDALIDNYFYYGQEAEKLQGQVNRVEDIDSFGALGVWLAERLGEQVPNIIGFMVSGGTGGLIAKGLQKGAIKQAEKEVLEQIAKRVIPRNIAARGQLAGGFGFAAALEGGGVAGEQVEAGFELQPGVVLPASLISGALETVGTGVVLKAFGLGGAFKIKFMDRLKRLPLAKRILATGSLVGSTEAGTELLQEINAIVSREIIDENYEALGEEGRSRVLNAAAGGFAVGSMMGGAGGVLPGRQGRAVQPPSEGTEIDYRSEVPIEDLSAAVGPSALVNLPLDAGEFGQQRLERQRTLGQELDAAFGEQQDVQIERLVEDQVEVVGNEAAPITALTEAEEQSLDEVRVEIGELTTQIDMLRRGEVPENNFKYGTNFEAITEDQFPDMIESTIDLIQQDIQRLALQLPENQLVSIDESGRVEYRNLNEAQTDRLNKLNAKLEEEGDLTDREWETYTILQEKAMQDISQEEIDAQKKTMPKEFKDEFKALAEEVLEEETVRLAEATRTQQPVPPGQHAMVQAIVDRIEKIFPSAPKVQVVDREQTMQDKVVYDNSLGARGLFVQRGNGPEIYIFSNANSTPLDVWRTYLHEVIGHGGIRSLFNEKDLKDFLRLIDKDLVEADEYVARLAEGRLTPPLLRRIIAFFRSWLRRLGLKNLKLSDDEIRAVLKNARRGFESKVKQHNFAELLDGPYQRLDSQLITVLARRMNLMNGRLGMDPDGTTPLIVDEMSGMWDFFKVKASKLLLTPLQIDTRYNIEEIHDYLNQGVHPWWNTKMKIISNVETLAQDWNKLDKNRAERLSKVLLEVTAESDQKQRRLSPRELLTFFNKHSLDEESRNLYARIDQEFTNLLDRLEQGILRNEARIHMGVDPTAFLNEFLAAENHQQATEVALKYDIDAPVINNLLKIQKQFGQLRNRNYFPYVRFGRYTITASAKEDMTYNGRSFKEGDSVFMYTYESRAEQLAGQREHAAALRNPRLDVRLSKLDDTEMSFSGLPPSLISNIEEQLNLTEDQQENLKHLVANMSPGRSFMKHLQKRKGLEGFSQDTLRAFSSYMFSAANHIARVEHYLDMTKALERLGNLRKNPEYQDSVVIQELHNYFKRHYNYIMNPGTDLAHVRALGFMWYLGGNVKSAAVNLTQVPMVAYPYLAARFKSDSGAVAALTKAMRDVRFGNRGQPNLTKFENEMLTRAIEEGFIDESQVTELAGMGESHVLARIMPTSAVGRGINKLSYAAGFLFHQAELYNRRVTFLAGLRMALKNSNNPEYAFQEAKRAVQTAQFEYAKWNRPEFMRGNKSVIFLFWQFMQHAAFLAAGGEGAGTAMRMLFMLLMAGGLQGLPFAENILDLIDFSSTKTRKMLGMKDPKVETRILLRELIQEFDDNPDKYMHGFGRYLGLGPLHIFAALGIPVPQADVTASLSMGRVIPGLEDMLAPTRDPEKRFARTIVEMGGPVMGMGWNFYRWATTDEPNAWKAAERTLPAALKNVSKAIRLQTYGREINRSGATIAEFEPGSAEQQAELAALALGFAPTRLNQKYELLAAQEEARRYWLTNRARLLEHYSYAVIVNDREGIADAKKAIRDFNRTAPVPQLRIQNKNMSQSIKIKRSKVRKMEAGQPDQRMFRGLYRDVQQAFPEAASQR